MNRTFSTIVTVLAVFIARVADVATTLHFTPSLSSEANPVMRLAGAHIGAAVLSNIAVVALLAFWPLWFYWRYPPETLSVQPGNLREFASLQLFNRILSRGEFLRFCFLGVPFPKNRRQFLRCFGFVMPWTLVFGSFVAVFSWWSRHAWHWQAYQHLRSSFGIGNYPVIDLLPCFPFAFLAAVVFFRSESAQSK